jgi:hypothetical protein
MEESNNSIPIGLQTLLSDLNFLSQIRRDTKPCCENRILISANSWGGAIYRYLKGENRNNVVSQVEKIVACTIDAIERYQNTDHIKIIVNYFSDAREGIAALLIVYANDPNITAKIKVQIDLIDIQLKRFRSLIKGFGERPIEFTTLNPEVNPEGKSEGKQDSRVEVKAESKFVPSVSQMTDDPTSTEFPGLTSNTKSVVNSETGLASSNSIDLFDSSENEKRKFRRNKIKVSEKIA